jgi:hypothetical protein
MKLNKRTLTTAAALTFAGGAIIAGSAVTASALPDASQTTPGANATSVYASKQNEVIVCHGTLSDSGTMVVASATAVADGTVVGSVGAPSAADRTAAVIANGVAVPGQSTGESTTSTGTITAVATSDGSGGAGVDSTTGSSGTVSAGPDSQTVMSGEIQPLPAGALGQMTLRQLTINPDGTITSSDGNQVIREGTTQECALPANG